jgi:hypothetical protein
MAGLVLALGAAALTPAGATTLLVGPDQTLKRPSDAARLAHDGDTVEIAPMKGGYVDCAVWPQNDLTIAGKGDDVVITDQTCAGKGLFITDGNNITIRNITFTRAHGPNKNGAGIRAEGGNLTLDHDRFIDNENGILAAPAPAATIIVTDSLFDGNGKCELDCAHGIYVNEVALLRIEHSVFRNTHIGHHIKSRAHRTELVGNNIADGPTGTSSYLVDIPYGGTLVMTGNVMEKGPKSDNRGIAIDIGEEGLKNRTAAITITGNKFTNDMSTVTDFVHNLTTTKAVLKGNVFVGKVRPLQGAGSVQ